MNNIKDEYIGSQLFVYTPDNQLIHFKTAHKNGDENTNKKTLIELKNIRCELTISVVVKTYNTLEQFYHITYDWKYIGNTPEERRLAESLHPMSDNEHFLQECNDGDIIYKNEMTDQIVKYLLKPINKIKEVNSSYNCPYEYQKRLFKIVALLLY